MILTEKEQITPKPGKEVAKKEKDVPKKAKTCNMGINSV
jgi:hypothetical protein